MRERRWSRGAGRACFLIPEDLGLIPEDLVLGIPVMHTVSVTLVVPKSACVRRMLP